MRQNNVNFNKNFDTKFGFSLAELLVVIAIIAVLFFVAFSNYYSHRGYSRLKLTTIQIASILNEARNRSMAADKNADWGVYFENSTSVTPFYSLFYSFYSTSTSIKRYNLPENVEFDTFTLPLGSSSTVIFEKLTGKPLATTTISLNLKIGNQIIATSSIFVKSTGLVDYTISQ